MEAEKQKKLPEGVGKRILETLKNREVEEEYEESFIETYEETEEASETLYEKSDEDLIAEEADEELIVCQEVIEEAQETEEIQEEIINEVIPAKNKAQAELKPVKAATKIKPDYSENEPYSDQEKLCFGISDIDTLLNLISQLPSGVTKQTGALIIRQTMEAMGISMNKVLGEAQNAQENLETSIRNNVNVIEEYRTKIKLLEQDIQKFRKKAHDLEDIISLFILSDEKRQSL